MAGEADLGKTSVINQACKLAATAGLSVALGRAHPMEANPPFGLMVQVLAGVGGRERHPRTLRLRR